MPNRNYYIVNAITSYLIITAPFLFLTIFTGYIGIFKWLLAVSFFTDAIDGYLARRYKVVSIFGARMDSIGDDLTVAAGILAIVVLKPEFIRREIVLVVPLLALFLLQTVFAFIRYGKMSSFHTYPVKMAAIMQAVFLCSLFFFNEPAYLLFYVTAGLTAIALVEEIILVSILPQWKTDVKGLYWVISKKRREESQNHFSP